MRYIQLQRSGLSLDPVGSQPAPYSTLCSFGQSAVFYVASSCVWRYARNVPWHAFLIATSTFTLRKCDLFSHDYRTLETFTLVGVCSCPDPVPCNSNGDGVMLHISAHVDISFSILHFFYIFLHFTFGSQCDNIIFTQSNLTAEWRVNSEALRFQSSGMLRSVVG